MIVPHDEVGTCAYRFGLESGASLGFATVFGEASVEVRTHMTGVDVMAIESNYCRGLQLTSARPEALKGRIMGGRGHLSNEQAIHALRAIRPRRHVVLLHLSRECNHPRLVTRLHEQRGYQVTVTSQFAPSPRVSIEPTPEHVATPDMKRVRQVQLPFGARVRGADLGRLGAKAPHRHHHSASYRAVFNLVGFSAYVLLPSLVYAHRHRLIEAQLDAEREAHLAQMREALERQTATAEVLQVISNSVADTKPVFDKILDSCQRLIACSDLAVMTVDDQQRVHVEAARGEQGRRYDDV